LVTPSLLNTWLRCAFTVDRLMYSCAATSGFERPSAIRATTCRSIGVRLCHPDDGRPLELRGPDGRGDDLLQWRGPAVVAGRFEPLVAEPLADQARRGVDVVGLGRWSWIAQLPARRLGGGEQPGRLLVLTGVGVHHEAEGITSRTASPARRPGAD
jgi:hypothetical protein